MLSRKIVHDPDHDQKDITGLGGKGIAG